MKIGIPLEVMAGEGRVALTPQACSILTAAGHSVYLQGNAGVSSGYADSDYSDADVQIVENAHQLYDSAQLIVKVKQPMPQDLDCLRSDHLLFCFLHLAADFGLIKKLCDIGLNAIPFESVEDSGHLPLLAPMSKVAGRIAVMRGASLLFRNRGGRGVLLGGVEGSDSGNVVILGAGVAGRQAVDVAVAMGASVTVLDLEEEKLQSLKQHYPSIKTHISTPERIESLCIEADLVIGAVLLAGRRAPVVLTESVVQKMNEGSVIIDIAIDQGGCVENIRATSSDDIFYIEHGVLHSAVPNMPAAVARTASQALSSVILPYVQILAENGLDRLAQSNDEQAAALYRARAIAQGEVVDEVLQQEFRSDQRHN